MTDYEEEIKWERRDGETSKAYDAFKYYLNTPASERSLRKCIDRLYPHAPEKGRGGKQSIYRQWGKWSSMWGWQSRVLAWDDHLARAELKAFTEEVEAMGKRHAQVAKMMMSVVIKRVKDMQPGELTPSDIRGWMNDSVRIERLAMGLEESRHGSMPLGIDVAQLSDDELDALRHKLSTKR